MTAGFTIRPIARTDYTLVVRLRRLWALRLLAVLWRVALWGTERLLAAVALEWRLEPRAKPRPWWRRRWWRRRPWRRGPERLHMTIQTILEWRRAPDNERAATEGR